MSSRRQRPPRCPQPDGAKSSSALTDPVDVRTEAVAPQPPPKATAFLPAWFEIAAHAALGGVVLPFLCWTPIYDPDCWFHMAFGRYLMEHGAFPPGDVFSYTAPGGEWISSGWASSWLLQMLYARAGLPGLAGAVLAVAVLVWGGLYAVAVACGARSLAMPLVLLGLMACSLRLTPRPEMATHLGLSLLFVLLLFAERSALSAPRRALALAAIVPLLMMVWANFHAGVLAGIPVILLACANWELRERMGTRGYRPLAIAAVGGAATWILNPYGFGLLRLHLKIHSFDDVQLYIMEWSPLLGGTQAMPLAASVGFIALLATAVALALWGIGRGGAPLWLVAAAAFFAVAVLRERRHLALGAVALVAASLLPLARMQAEWICTRSRQAIAIGVTTLLAAILVLLQSLGGLAKGSGWPHTGLDDSLLPVHATSFLAEAPPPSELFNDYGPGGYLLYHLGPAQRVFIDGRLDVYTPQVWSDFRGIINGRFPIDQAEKKYDIRSVLLYTRGAGPGTLSWHLGQHGDWAVCYYDDVYALFVRRSPDTEAYIAQHGFRFANPYAFQLLRGGIDNPQTRDAALAEVDRARRISKDSGKALLIAAQVERWQGREANAAALEQQASEKNPGLAIAKP